MPSRAQHNQPRIIVFVCLFLVYSYMYFSSHNSVVLMARHKLLQGRARYVESLIILLRKNQGTELFRIFNSFLKRWSIFSTVYHRLRFNLLH